MRGLATAAAVAMALQAAACTSRASPAAPDAAAGDAASGDAEPAMLSARDAEGVVDAAVVLDAAQRGDAEPLDCAGRRCRVPVRFDDPSVHACCYEARRCGVRIVGVAGVSDACIPVAAPGQPNADCPSTQEASGYTYGCCLENLTCGFRLSQVSASDPDFGCIDPLVLGRPAGAACDPANSCQPIGAECASGAECCAIGPGTLCRSFGGEPATCATPCVTDQQCPTLCCRDTASGDRACAPLETCNADADAGA